MTKEQSLELAYSQEKEYVYDVGQREFDCLIYLIEDGTITEDNIEQYGIYKR